jgi:hypothetical protein
MSSIVHRSSTFSDRRHIPASHTSKILFVHAGTLDAPCDLATGLHWVHIGSVFAFSVFIASAAGMLSHSSANQKEYGMDGLTRRALEMGGRVVKLKLPQPDGDAGYALAAAKVEELVARGTVAAAEQLDGLIDRHAASVEKENLRREILAGPVAHLATVGKVAKREQHELGSLFRFKPEASSLLAVRTAAGNMLANAETHREVLVKYGLSVPVLERFGRLLQQFDAAVAMGDAGRARHIGATQELHTIAAEIVRTVRVMDGSNRRRFKNDPNLLAAWINASTIVRAPQVSDGQDGTGGTASPAGDVRPAA